MLSVLLEEVEVEKAPIWFDMKVFDGAAVVHLLPTNNVTTIEEHANVVFIPHVKKNMHTCKCVDVVWDTTLPAVLNCQQGRSEGKESEGR